MLTTKDLENALKKNYVDFSEAVKAVLTEKLDNHPVIKSKMDEIEQYDSISEKCDEMVCKKHDDEKEDEPLDDEDEKEEKDSDDEDSDDDDSDEDSDDDEDDEDSKDGLNESLSYEKGRNYLIPLRETRGRRIRLKLVEKETLEGKLEDFDRKYVYLGNTRCLPDDYWIDGMNVPWKNIESIEFIKETGRRIF